MANIKVNITNPIINTELKVSNPTFPSTKNVINSSQNSELIELNNQQEINEKLVQDIQERAKMFIFDQAVPVNVWIIAHSLNKYPSVTIKDSANQIVVGDIEYINLNNLEVRFSVVFSGKAYLV